MDSPTGAGGAFRHRVDYEGRTPALRLPLRRSRWAPLATLGLLALPLFHLAQWRHDWTWSIAVIAPAGESLGALVCQPGRDQPVGDHLFQVIGGARLHARGDFLGKEFEQKIRHDGLKCRGKSCRRR